MKALSIRQPWAHWILHEGKDVENRMWSTTYRGPLLIHASKTWASRPVLWRRRKWDRVDSVRIGNRWIYAPGLLARGAIVGMVRLVGCVQNSPSPWAEPGQYHWLLEEPLAFCEPIPYRGRQGVFDVDDLLVDDAIRNAEADELIQQETEAARRLEM